MLRTLAIAAILAVLALGTTVAGCSTPPNTTQTPAAGPATPPPMEPTPETGPATVIQSSWGPIWDAVPPELLVFAGAEPVEIDDPVSIALDHPAQAADPEAVVQAYLIDLEAGGWRAVMDGPLDDGSAVVDAARDDTSCRLQVRATPLGGVVRITILYGADCGRP